MSAWPEAAWIVKSIQKNFDFEQKIEIYTQNLNILNRKINTTIDEINDLEEEINSLVYKGNTIRATSVDSITEEYSKGTICLIVNTL